MFELGLRGTQIGIYFINYWLKKPLIACINVIFFIFSGSMEPAFFRGDLLFLTNYREEPIRVGEIVVFKIEGRDIPIVHRVLKVHEK